MRYGEATLRDMIERNARWYGDRPAFVCGEEMLTHAQFRDGAYRIASALNARGLVSQDRVSVLSMNSIEFCLTYGACEAFGFIAATVNFRLAAAEMLYILNDSASRVLIFEAAYIDVIDGLRDRLETIEHFVVIGDVDAPAWAINWTDFLEEADPSGPDLPTPGPRDLVYLIYTSGTTGRPKGCMLDHYAETATGQIIAAAMQLAVSDRTLLMMPLFHIGAKAIALAQQWVGGAVHLHRVFDPAAICATIEAERITATHMAPTLVQALVEAPEREHHDLSSLRTLLYSAAAMPAPLLTRALAAFGPIFQQMYGQTEGIGTLLPLTAHEVDQHGAPHRHLNSVGHPFIGCEVSIRSVDETPVPAGGIGEICIRGPVIMQGYWNNSEATLETLRDGWLHTGDVGYLDAEGYAYLVDRKKDVIISGGENIYSREVEDAILSHPSVAGVAVIGTPDPKWGEAVTAVVVLRPGVTIAENDLIAHCRTLIAGYKRPRRVIFSDGLPALPSGKINKPALRASLISPEPVL
ncbi:MAG: acyl-CoA synthetase (AMP-forming)/AMP-acid ligase [Brevundimonas sp.]|nr:acyl-CoA synthetase (AMP-forming)/AMP-acid ligase [Brevundimonas sp.]